MKIEMTKNSFKCSPELIEPEFGGISGMNIRLEAQQPPRITVDVIVFSKFDIEIDHKNPSLRLLDYNTDEYKEVAKVIFFDGTEVYF